MIGIVGAAGAVGRAAATALHRGGNTELRLGGRRREALEELALRLPGSKAVTVDLFDPTELASFCHGCEVVLNSAGPAFDVDDRVARGSITAGADYVDAAGDDVLFQRLTRVQPVRATATAMVSAGMMPGLTALLPRYLAQITLGEPQTLTGYVGGQDRFTVTAAADYFRGGSSFGAARTVLRDGMRVPETRSTNDASLPFFPERASAMAFLSTEVERVCARLGIGEASWYSVFTGEHVTAAVRVPTGDGTAEALARAAALDSFGRRTYQLMVLEMATSLQTRTLVLRGRGASELTGEFAALATHAVARKWIPAGVHHTGEILDPVQTVAQLRDCASVEDITVLDGSAYETGSYVEDAV